MILGSSLESHSLTDKTVRGDDTGSVNPTNNSVFIGTVGEEWRRKSRFQSPLTIDILDGQFDILKTGLDKFKRDCVTAYAIEGMNEECVAPMIKRSESNLQKRPLLQSIYLSVF